MSVTSSLSLLSRDKANIIGMNFIIPSHNEVVERIKGLSRTYVCTYIRSYICSPFVITLVTLFVNQF